MDNLRKFFAPQPDAEPPASVLAEWNSYSKAGPSTVHTSSHADRVVASLEEGQATVSRFVGESFGYINSGVTGMGASVSSSVPFVPSGMQLTYFMTLLGTGIVFLILAFTLFLPVIILAPAKFALTFSIGSSLILASFSALRGWRQQCMHMFSTERLPFTAAYLGSLAGTIYASVAIHSYVLSLLCCGFQVLALLYYIASYFPGGAVGARFLFQMSWNVVARTFGACFQVFSR